MVSDKNRLSKRKSNLETRYSRLIMMVADGELAPDERINKNLSEISAQIDALEHELARLSVRINFPVKNFGDARLQDFAVAVQEYLMDADDEKVKQLMLSTVTSVKVVEGAKKVDI